MQRISELFKPYDAGDGCVDRSVIANVLFRLNPLVWDPRSVDKLLQADWVPVCDKGRIRYELFLRILLGSDRRSTSKSQNCDVLSETGSPTAARNSLRTGLELGTVKGYSHWTDDMAVVIRCRPEDECISVFLKQALEACWLSTTIVTNVHDIPEGFCIWLVTPCWDEFDLASAELYFDSSSGALLCPAGLEMNEWASGLSAQGSAGPMITMSISYEMLRTASPRYFDVLKTQWMARLWTKLMRLMGLTTHRTAFEICQAIDILVQGRLAGCLPETDGVAPEVTPRVIGFIGSTSFYKPWTCRLLRLIAADLARMNNQHTDVELVILTGGLHNRLEMGLRDNQGVGYTVAQEYDRLGGMSFHLLPATAKDRDYGGQACHLADGTFAPVAFGTTLFAGASTHEHLALMSQACDIVFCLEGAYGTSVQVEAALACDVPVVPIRATGGAASGKFNMPDIGKMFYISEEDWSLVADNGIAPADCIPDERLEAIAAAVARITYDTIHSFSATKRCLEKAAKPNISDSASSSKTLRAPTSSLGSRVRSNLDHSPREELLQLPKWSLSRNEFMSPLDVVTSPPLAPLHSLLTICERPLRVYGRWNKGEYTRVYRLLETLQTFLENYVDANRTERYVRLMKKAYKVKAKKFRRVYSTVVQDIIQQEASFGAFQEVCERVRARIASTSQGAPPQQHVAPSVAGLCVLLEVYRQAQATSTMLESFCEKIARMSGVRFLKVPLKRMWRALEKLVLKYSHSAKAADGGDLGAGALELKDIARSALEGSMDQLTAALDAMLGAEEVSIVRIKSRFAESSSMGWADCQIMLCFKDSEFSHICEIQLVHPQLMLVRKGMGAHHEYKSIRAAEELLTLYDEVLPSIANDHYRYLCRASGEVSFPSQLKGKTEPTFHSLSEFREAVHEIHGKTWFETYSEFLGACPRMSVIYGIADQELPSGGEISLRWESEDFVCFDSDRRLSPLHLVIMPTATSIPDWRFLFAQPSEGLELLARMRRIGADVTRRFLQHEAWREHFLKRPPNGWPDWSDDDAVAGFCAENSVCGFCWPPMENQLSLHWVLLPIFPWNFVERNDIFGRGQFVPLDFAEMALRCGAKCGVAKQRRMRQQPWARLLEELECVESYNDAHRAMEHRASVRTQALARWTDIFRDSADEDGSVWAASACGCWELSADGALDVQARDERRLASFGQPWRSDAQPEGSFYSFPKAPGSLGRSFVQPARSVA